MVREAAQQKKKMCPQASLWPILLFFATLRGRPDRRSGRRSAWWARRGGRIAVQWCVLRRWLGPPSIGAGGWWWPAHPRNRPPVPRLARPTRPAQPVPTLGHPAMRPTVGRGAAFCGYVAHRPPCARRPPSRSPRPVMPLLPPQGASIGAKRGICRYVARPTLLRRSPRSEPSPRHHAGGPHGVPFGAEDAKWVRGANRGHARGMDSCSWPMSMPCTWGQVSSVSSVSSFIIISLLPLYPPFTGVFP